MKALITLFAIILLTVGFQQEKEIGHIVENPMSSWDNYMIMKTWRFY